MTGEGGRGGEGDPRLGRRGGAGQGCGLGAAVRAVRAALRPALGCAERGAACGGLGPFEGSAGGCARFGAGYLRSFRCFLGTAALRSVGRSVPLGPLRGGSAERTRGGTARSERGGRGARNGANSREGGGQRCNAERRHEGRRTALRRRCHVVTPPVGTGSGRDHVIPSAFPWQRAVSKMAAPGLFLPLSSRFGAISGHFRHCAPVSGPTAAIWVHLGLIGCSLVHVGRPASDADKAPLGL